MAALVPAMTGFDATFDGAPIEPDEFASGLARRTLQFRSRIVQKMVLLALILRPLPALVAERVAAFAAELDVREEMLAVAGELAKGNYALAAVDFDRNGYIAGWRPEEAAELHTSGTLSSAWELAVDDPALAQRWADLESLPQGTLGRLVTGLYRARGFVYPGRPGSAPPLLAQHDWVHVLADYGTTVESELEVFAFIARANDDPHAFSLLAMIISLFETGYLRNGAGLFEAAPGHLSERGMAARVADALRRGALCPGSTDFLRIDWFTIADLPLQAARQHFEIPDKSAKARRAGSVSPWEPGGITPYQVEAGMRMAASLGIDYDDHDTAHVG
jgi:hypothetical protein